MSVGSQYEAVIRASLEEMLKSKKFDHHFFNAYLKLEIPLWQSGVFVSNDLPKTIEMRKQMVTRLMMVMINFAKEESDLIVPTKYIIQHYSAYFDCDLIGAYAKEFDLEEFCSVVESNRRACSLQQEMISAILKNDQMRADELITQGCALDEHILEISRKSQNLDVSLIIDRVHSQTQNKVVVLSKSDPPPADTAIRETLFQAIYTNDTALIQALINQGYVPDLDCLLFATCVAHPDCIAIINSSIVANQLKSVLVNNDVCALKTLTDAGVVIDSAVMLDYLSLGRHELIAPLYQAAIENNSRYDFINALIRMAPDIFTFLPTTMVDLQSSFGYDLVRFCIKSGDLLNLYQLKDMKQSLESLSISMSDLRLYLRLPSSNETPSVNDLLTLLGILKNLGWTLNAQLKDQILRQLAELPEQPVTSIVMAIREDKFQDFQPVDGFRIGHTLGLSNQTMEIGMGAVGKMHYFGFEGNAAFDSLNYLLENMGSYVSQLTEKKRESEKQFFSEIRDSFQFVQSECFDKGQLSSDASKRLMQRYLDNKMAILPAGWVKHAVSVVLYKGYLIYTNRGDGGDFSDNTKIYKIRKDATLNEESIDKLLKTHSGLFLEKTMFLETLQTLVDVTNPIATLPSKYQKHGNCTYANKLSSIEAMLCFLEADDISPNFTDEQLQTVIQSSIEKREQGPYKKFTRFARDQEINLFIQALPKVVGNHFLMEHYFGIVKAIISQHHGASFSDVKNRNELKHVKQLFEALPLHYKDRLLSEWPEIEKLVAKANDNKRSKPMIISMHAAKTEVANQLSSQSLDAVNINSVKNR